MSNINNDMTLQEIRVEYYKHIQSLAEEIKEYHEDSVGADEIHEAADASEWVIYDYLNRLVSLVSDNSDAIDYHGDFAEMDNLDMARAFYAIAADLAKQLEDME